MTTLIPSALPPTGPSPARNPFARPKLPSASSFTRTSLLPSHVSPKKTQLHSVTTPADRIDASVKGTSSVGKDRKSWRLLWRGGLEVGHSGYRLEGIMFYAMLAFPSTPSHSQGNVNPFDFISPPRMTPSNATSPFALPTADTDLCLSLESMRGRKYLQVRGLTELPAKEILEGDTDESGVQISISPQAPLLAGYLTSILCRSGKLSEHGRTLNAIIIGLGDEGVDSSQNTSLLVYGQRQVVEKDSSSCPNQSTLKLCVARRKLPPPPPSVRKIRPGDPLPRAPLFFPSRSFSKKLSHRPLSRTTSSASIYAPPVLQHSVSAPIPVVRTHSLGEASTCTQLPPAPISGRTPGRRGEKRKRPQAEEDEKRRKSGKVVVDREGSQTSKRDAEGDGDGDEDIFGKRPSAKTASFELQTIDKSELGEPGDGEDKGEEQPSTAKKRPRVPPQILDNKASIRKQTMLLLESSGYARDHELFKEIFSMVTKGTYFAFRSEMENGPLCKLEVQRIVGVHLEMYLPQSSCATQDAVEDEKLLELDDKLEILRSIKEEDEGGSGSGDTLVDIGDIKPKAEL